MGGFIEETNRDIHLRLTVYGEEFPEIERDYIYHWKLQITGNRDYPDIDELIMEVSFYPEDEAYFHIKEGVPTKRDREIGNLLLSG